MKWIFVVVVCFDVKLDASRKSVMKRPLTCGHDSSGRNGHDGDVLRRVRLVDVCAHGRASSSCARRAAALLFGDHPQSVPRLRRAGDGEHCRGVVRGGGGRGRVRGAELLLGFVQEHGALNLEGGGGGVGVGGDERRGGALRGDWRKRARQKHEDEEWEEQGGHGGEKTNKQNTK